MNLLNNYLKNEQKFIFFSFLNKEKQQNLLELLQQKNPREYRKLVAKINSAEQEKSLFQKEQKIGKIEIDKLQPNPYQPRRSFNTQKIEELSQSIKKHGQISPILVSKQENGYVIIAGERRYRAIKLLQAELPLKYAKIDAKILQNTNEEQLKILSLLENTQRENLTVFEEAQTYQMLNKNMTIIQIAEKTGKSTSTIGRYLKIANLPEEIIQLAKEKNINSIALLEEASKLTSKDKMKNIVEKYSKGETIQNIKAERTKEKEEIRKEEQVELKKPAQQISPFLKDDFETENEEELSIIDEDIEDKKILNKEIEEVNQEKTTQEVKENKIFSKEEVEEKVANMILKFNEKITKLEEQSGFDIDLKIIYKK